MRKYIIVTLVGLCLGAVFARTALCETRLYKKTVGDKEYAVTCTIERDAGGYHIRIDESRNGRAVITEDLDIDPGFSTRSWSIVNREQDIEVAATREGKVLHLTYREDGRRRRKTSRIDDGPWYQLFALSFEKFAAGQKDGVTFWSVNPEEVKPYEFSLTRESMERRQAAGSSTRCVRIRIALTGFLAAFWHAESWHRAEDGLFVRYEGVNGRPGSPLTTVQLLEVEK